MTFLGLGLFELIFLGIWIFAMIDVLVTPAEEVRNLQKVLWFIIVLLGFQVIGAAFWFVFGRPKTKATTSVGRGVSRGRGMGPDDDVDFLRSLNRPPD